jgi:hypothetical protein
MGGRFTTLRSPWSKGDESAILHQYGAGCGSRAVKVEAGEIEAYRDEQHSVPDAVSLHSRRWPSGGTEADAVRYPRLLRGSLCDPQPGILGYFLASRDEDMRQKSLRFVKEWIDAAAFLGSSAIRVNTESGDFGLCVKSFRDLAVYSAEKGVILLVENHGGISADPALHVRLIREVNHKNIRTAPDFGNHKPDIRYEALKAIMPYAYEVEPKALPFDDRGEHTGYDFGRCMRIAVESGFSGIYSVDYWDRDAKPVNYEKICDWLIEHVLEFL